MMAITRELLYNTYLLTMRLRDVVVIGVQVADALVLKGVSR